MHSCLYTGWVRHRRFAPTENSFRYRLFMTYLDLAELPELFDRYWLWSARGPAPAWFRREDYHGNATKPLDAAVRDLVESRLGRRPQGPIRLLTHLRFFGYCFNPVSFYYCFDRAGERVETIAAEITNTPWKERHAYVLPLESGARDGAQAWRFQFGKEFHVSPFMPMAQRYDWRFTEPGGGLYVHMENWQDDGGRTFDATLNDQNLITRIVTWLHSPVIGDTMYEAVFFDYKDFGGVKFPTRIVQREGGFSVLDVNIYDVTPNGAVPIEVPANIRTPAS